MNETPITRIAVTLGDPRGIGPEVTRAAARAAREAALPVRLTFVGPEGVDAGTDADAFVSIGRWNAGDSTAQAGQLAGRAIESAVQLIRDGHADALLTAPIDKAALHAGGYDFPGHTEMLAALTGVPEVVMMMAAEHTRLGGPLRVVLATTHLPLASVPATLTTDLLIGQIRLTFAALRDQWGIAEPRLALCAFNPHASDHGLFGDEEARIMMPAVSALAAEGINVNGPIPADTVFVRALEGEFDAVIAPYHDVGMAAFKTASFGQGVNVTLGLPFPRTSPDHGTAIDIAGKGLANPSSMIEALELAVRLTRTGNPLAPSR